MRFRSLVPLTLAFLLAACGAHPAPGKSGPAKHPGGGSTVQPGGQGKLPIVNAATENLGPLLPVALEGASAAALNGKIYIFGGYGPAGFSATVYAFTPAQGKAPATLTRVGALPVAMHDQGAAAATGGIYVCGGGRAVGTDGIYLWNGQAATLAGRLPQAMSDMSGVTLGGVPYCLGGWNGRSVSGDVFKVQAGQPSVVAHLAQPVRYGAAAALPGGILVSGGRLANSSHTSAIQWVPLGGGQALVVAALPYNVDKAMAVGVGQTALVAGGCESDGLARSGIWTVTKDGLMQGVGNLPTGLCYGAAALLDGEMYVFGGIDSAGTAQRNVLAIRPLVGFPGG